MKKLFLMAIISLVCLGIQAQIKPQSMGVQEVKAIGGFSDIFVKLSYNPQTGYEYILRDMNADVYEHLPLGKTIEEAQESVRNLYNTLMRGQKNEIFNISETITIKKVNNTRLNVYIYPVTGYIQKRHLLSTLEYFREQKGEQQAQ